MGENKKINLDEFELALIEKKTNFILKEIQTLKRYQQFHKLYSEPYLKLEKLIGRCEKVLSERSLAFLETIDC